LVVITKDLFTQNLRKNNSTKGDHIISEFDNKDINKVMLIEKSIFDFSEEIVNNFLLQSSTKSTLLLVFNFSKDLLEYEKDSESKAVITHFRSFSCEKFQFLEVFYIILIVIYI